MHLTKPPLYHLAMSVLRRAVGRSSVAASAYRSASRMVDERTGLVADYTGKTHVTPLSLFLPVGCPEIGREILWNRIEAHNRRADAVVAREIDAALPRGLSRSQEAALAERFGRWLADTYRIAVDIGIHRKPGNPHLDILMSANAVLPGGVIGKKVRELDAVARQRLKGAPNPVETIRAQWAEMINHALAEAGRAERVDHRSYARQQLPWKPTFHLGRALTGIEARKPGSTEAGKKIAAIHAENERIRQDTRRTRERTRNDRPERKPRRERQARADRKPRRERQPRSNRSPVRPGAPLALAASAIPASIVTVLPVALPPVGAPAAAATESMAPGAGLRPAGGRKPVRTAGSHDLGGDAQRPHSASRGSAGASSACPPRKRVEGPGQPHPSHGAPGAGARTATAAAAPIPGDAGRRVAELPGVAAGVPVVGDPRGSASGLARTSPAASVPGSASGTDPATTRRAQPRPVARVAEPESGGCGAHPAPGGRGPTSRRVPRNSPRRQRDPRGADGGGDADLSRPAHGGTNHPRPPSPRRPLDRRDALARELAELNVALRAEVGVTLPPASKADIYDDGLGVLQKPSALGMAPQTPTTKTDTPKTSPRPRKRGR